MKKKYYFKNYLVLIAVVLSHLASAQSSLKTIQGVVTLNNTPLQDVNIIIEGTTKGTKTDDQGSYNLQVKKGDQIQFRYVGLKTVSIVVEDVTSILNVRMAEDKNQLEETVITARKKMDYSEELIQRMDIDLKLPNGTINPYKSGFDIKHLEGEKLTPGSPNLASALNGKFEGVIASGTYPNQTLTIRGLPVTYILNGIAYDDPPIIPLEFIKDIFIIKTKAQVVILLDDTLETQIINREKIAEKHRNQNFYADDAKKIDNETLVSSAITTRNNKVEKLISGVVTSLNAPLSNVNIKIKKHVRGTKTDTQGHYEITANIGDILEFSHVGFHTTSVIIEDITSTLNIDLIAKSNELDEVTVKTVKSNVLKRIEKAEKPVVTSRGVLDPKRATYPISFIDGDLIKPIYPSLTQGLIGKMAGITRGVDNEGNERIMVKPGASIFNPVFAIWDVDGQIFELEPPMDLNNIKSIHILKTLSATNKYGSAGAGGVVIVRTKNGTFDSKEAERNKIAEQFQNKNYYSNDTLRVDTKSLVSNSYTVALESLNNVQKAYTYYNERLKNEISNYGAHISIAHAFMNFYNSRVICIEVLTDVAVKHSTHPEILKAVAYQFQAINAKRDAVNMYETIFKLRPKYAQSYRDLANAYVENAQFNKAWRLYMSYLLQGNNGIDDSIGQMVYNEMEFLYYNRKRQTQIKEMFEPKSKNLLDFRNDVRIVFEWNTSEAEFDLEFVSPDKRAYVFEHSLLANDNLIHDEKRKGYSSTDFFIEDIDNGEWLINLTYKGNKKPDPTYFKMTIYYNWGKAAQKKETLVYNLTNEHYKIQLKEINKNLLIVNN